MNAFTLENASAKSRVRVLFLVEQISREEIEIH
jgi:hypothetical protein